MKLSKDTKDTIQIIAMSVIGTFVVLYQQGYILSDKDNNKEKIEKVVQAPDSTNIAQRDTVAMHVFRDAKQLKR